MTTHEPILKIQWERYRAHFDLNRTLAEKLIQPFSSKTIKNIILLSEGCANSNFKIEFTAGYPVVLRIYLRENDSLAREIALHQLLHNKIPIPQIFYSDVSCSLINHPYAIMEFVNGELMRNVMLSGNEQAIAECAFSAGRYLNQLRMIRFSQGGFFNSDLSIKPFAPDEEYQAYTAACLEKTTVQESLGLDLVKKLSQLIAANENLLPNKDDANLTHADFDPANMLVQKTNGTYRVSGILDWEFAFAGWYLLDIGLFLRYSHKLPTIYEKKFIAGVLAEGTALPCYWKKSAKLMDILSLLSLLYWNPKQERPNLNRDVVALLQYTIDHWDEF